MMILNENMFRLQIDIMVRNMKDEGSLDKLLTTEIFPESIANLSVVTMSGRRGMRL